jgi:lipopolysaccharide export system protein LptA
MRLNWRTIYVAALALQVILAAYFLFTLLAGRSRIRVEKSYAGNPPPVPDSNEVGRLGPVGIGTVQKARFVNFNDNKQVSREFGFERLLHRAGDQWQIAKPFLNLYQPDFECHITAATAVVTADELNGIADIKEATLKDNVVIHIVPTRQADLGPIDVYLDDIVFISNRSMFLTAGPVKMLAKNMQLLGRGLEVVYNYNNDRLELFRIIDLESLCLNRIRAAAATVDGQSSGPFAVDSSPSTDSQGDTAADKYRAVLTGNVMVRSGTNVLLADDKLTIENIMRKRQNAPQVFHGTSDEPNSSPADENDYLDVVVTSDRGLVVFPMNMPVPQSGLLTALSTQPAYRQSSLVQAAAADVNCLKARDIEYDVSTGEAQAVGPLKLTYRTASTEKSGNAVTVTIAAQKKLTFARGSGRVVFEGNCLSTFVPDDVKKSRAYSIAAPKIIGTFAAQQYGIATARVQHVAAEGGAVAAMRDLQSDRQVARLCAPRIDYFADSGNVMASGPSELILSRTSSDTQSGKNKTEPVRITAEEGIQFNPASNSVSFEGGCFCETTVGHPTQPRKYTLNTESILVELQGGQEKTLPLEAAGLKKIIARDGAVLTAVSVADQSKIAQFTANEIQYDSGNDNITAPGPSRLLLFRQNLRQFNSGAGAPVTITSQDSTVFSLASNQALFRGRCICTMVRVDAGTARKYKLSAPEVTVDLASAGGGVFGSSGIDYLTAGDDAIVVVTPIDSITELARFTASRIQYSAASESVTAQPPCDFTFYASDFLPTHSLGAAVPVQIFAQKNAKFMPSQNQLTFEGDCICTMERSNAGTQNKYTLSAPKITIDLAQPEQQRLAGSALAINRFTADGGVVQISSVKTAADSLAALNRIKCGRFIYDTGQELFTAIGPGIITVDNAGVDQPAKETQGFAISGRCYAFLRDFETLRLDLRNNRIVARNDSSKILADYFPVVNGRNQEQIKASAGLVELELSGVDGRNEISAFRASRGITYEDPNNQFIAAQMSYDAATGLLKAQGDESQRCYLNGAIVDNVVYDLNRHAVLNVDVTDAGRAQLHSRKHP